MTVVKGVRITGYYLTVLKKKISKGYLDCFESLRKLSIFGEWMKIPFAMLLSE